jgi:hypothetical protein
MISADAKQMSSNVRANGAGHAVQYSGGTSSRPQFLVLFMTPKMGSYNLAFSGLIQGTVLTGRA